METRGRKRRQPDEPSPNGMEQPPETSDQSSAKAGAKKRSKGKAPASEDKPQPEELVSTRDIKDLWKEMGYSVLLEIFRHFEVNKRFEMSRVSKEWNTVLSNTALLTKHYLFVEDDAKCSKAIQNFQIKDRETQLRLFIVGNGKRYGGSDSTDETAIKGFLLKNPQVRRVIFYKAAIHEEQIVNDRSLHSMIGLTTNGEDFWYLVDCVTLIKCQLKIQFHTRIPQTPDDRLWSWTIELPRKMLFAFKDKNKPIDLYQRWGLYFKEMSKQKVFWPYPPEQMDWLKNYLPKVRGAAKKHMELFLTSRQRNQYVRVKKMPGLTETKLWDHQLFERDCGILLFQLMVSGMKGLEYPPCEVPEALADFDYI